MEHGAHPHDENDRMTALLQAVYKTCLDEPQLQNELILMLIRQTLCPPSETYDAYLRSWQLLTLTLGVFLPVREVYPYVRICLLRAAKRFELVPKIHQYAVYCVNIMDQALDGQMKHDGETILVRHRSSPPSRIEVASMLAASRGNFTLIFYVLKIIWY